MLKLTVAVLAVALAGTASAAGWRSLRIDGSSEGSFRESVAELQEKLTPGRRHAFARSLQDIWAQGTKEAEAEQREYTAGEYFRQLDGLGYEEVVTFTDPTGDTAQRYRAEYVPVIARPPNVRVAASPGPRWNPPPPGGRGRSDAGDATARAECGCAFPHPWH